MFSLKIIDTDNFLEMPISARELYFQFGMRADDDGFVGNPKRIMKMIGTSDDDIKVLIAKKFIIPFESGVCVISDWRVHNLLREDRYTETIFKKEKQTLLLGESGSYIKRDAIEEKINEIPKLERPQWQKNREKVYKESSLPYSFEYKIKRAFLGKKCPVCGIEMKEIRQEEKKYGYPSNPKPSIQHNIPISKGGKHELGNISIICHSCNASLQENGTNELNSKEVIEIWNSIGNQSAPQVRLELGKDRLDKDNNTCNDDVVAGIEKNTITTLKATSVRAKRENRPGKEIEYLISLFKDINPSYERFFSNKSQRAALERLTAKHGQEKIENTIKILPQIINKPYAPRITTPLQLESKLGELGVFYNQEKTKEKSRGIKVSGL